MPVTENDLALDRELAQICGLIPLLRLVTPTNVTQARDQFISGTDEPDFEYRDLPRLNDLKSRVEAINSQQADDPVIASLVEGLLASLKLRLRILANRGTDSFFLDSVELFGNVEDTILELAQSILTSQKVTSPRHETVSALEFAEAARSEIDLYRRSYPEMRAEVRVSETTPGVMVEGGNLYVGTETRIARSRVVQLLQHEVGTHIVTFENGLFQPLHILSLGLANYDELQEALGVVAEYLAGGLQFGRLRILAYRVVAARMRGDGASFRETFDALSTHGCAGGTAFITTMRAYRAGGMTKDAIYLRGLVRLLDYISAGGDFERLYIGKISFEAVPLIQDLCERGILTEPPLRPRFLDFNGASDRLKKLQNGLNVLELGASN